MVYGTVVVYSYRHTHTFKLSLLHFMVKSSCLCYALYMVLEMSMLIVKVPFLCLVKPVVKTYSCHKASPATTSTVPLETAEDVGSPASVDSNDSSSKTDGHAIVKALKEKMSKSGRLYYI